MCVEGGSRKIHANVQPEFPRDGLEADILIHAHVQTLTRHSVLVRAVGVRGSRAQAEPAAGSGIVHCTVSDMQSLFDGQPT